MNAKRRMSGCASVAISRRHFLAGCGAALAPVLGFPAVVKLRKPNELLSHACIGTANMAAVDMAEIASHRDVHVTALCDVDAAFLEKAKKLHPDARVYRDAFEMFAAEGDRIDSVNVSTPDHTHAGYMCEALRRGLNVYGQKPLCHDLADCRELERLAREKNAVTQMGTQIAAWECDRRTVAALRTGAIGDVRHVWLFSTRRSQPAAECYRWPLPPSPVPETLDWKLWLGPAPERPFAAGAYHPRAWRKWRAFGTSWLGDLGLHLMSPVWLGLRIGALSPETVCAEIADDGWTPAQREQFWPSMSHVTWTFPGIKASGGKPFDVEWCDGFWNARRGIEPRFFPPAFLRDLAARTPMGDLPPQGRVIEGTEGWLLSTHFDEEPVFVMKNGKTAPAMPMVGAAPSHYHEYVNACLQGGETTSSFAWACRMTEWGFLGNLAQLQPGKRLVCANMK